ncbi:prepilin peptidase [Sphingorhabdus sp.]|uniref:A24 family peptidase n=1 Tax=Sphingorhabdus sp. TaxID=1902408 RepID=UPI001B528D90|nr:prepilin peptidase [Sphingorhabdus sp.]
MIENGILAAAAFVLLGAAYSDLKQFKIPNLMPALLLALYGCYVAIVGLSAFSWWHAAHFAIALIVGMALFAMKWFGGGDAKLYAAVALWFPLQKGPFLLFYVGMAGLVLAIMFMLTRRFTKGADGKKRTDRRIPYGVAIAVGAIACWLLQAPGQPTKMNVGDLDNRGLPSL